MTEDDKRKQTEDEGDKHRKREHEGDHPGAEGGSGGSFDTPPPIPNEDDESPLGDTDQHSGANA